MNSPIMVDQYFPATARLEVITGEILKAIGGNPRLLQHYISGLECKHTAQEMTEYADQFLVNIEKERQWADKNLWWM